MDAGNVEAVYPLSPQQLGMFYETLAASGSGMYVEQELGQLSGPLDEAAFAEAWRTVVNRHETLRTAIVWRNVEQPLQVVLKRVELPIDRRDWSGSPPSEQQAMLDRHLREDRERGFELSAAPLLRVGLFRTGPAEHQLVWSQHHIVMDGWCLPIIVGELVRAYTSLCAGEQPYLPPVQPYSHYLGWLARQDLAAAERHWRHELSGVEEPTPLGPELDVAGEPTAAERFGQVEAELPERPTVALTTLARQHRVTPSMLLHGIWSLLLSRYSGRTAVVVGTTVSGRPPELPGVESIVGLFMNTLPLRVEVDRDAALWGWVAGMQERHLALRDYEYCSTGQVHQWSEVPPTLPLYESVIVFENYPDAEAPAAGSGFTGARTSTPLTLVIGAGAKVTLRAVFDRGRITEESAALRLRHMVRLLEHAASRPAPAVAELLELVPENELPPVRPLARAGGGLGGDYLLSRNETEEAIAGIWREVLRLDRVGMRDDFFRLGGHSLLGTQLISRLRSTFELDVPLQTLFETPTIEGLAQVIDEMLLEEIEALPEGVEV